MISIKLITKEVQGELKYDFENKYLCVLTRYCSTTIKIMKYLSVYSTEDYNIIIRKMVH